MANEDFDVHGVDIVQDTVDTINRGEIHIVENDLEDFVKNAVQAKSPYELALNQNFLIFL